MMQQGNEIRIRRAAVSDLETVVQFNLAMARETEGKDLAPATLRAGATAVLEREELGFYLLAELDGVVAGQLLITYEWSDWRNGFFWWIQSVYVREDCRRRGVYRALAGRVTELAKQRGDVCGVRLYVDRDNAVAQEVYRRLGMAQSHYDLYETEFGG